MYHFGLQGLLAARLATEKVNRIVNSIEYRRKLFIFYLNSGQALNGCCALEKDANRVGRIVVLER